MQRELELKLELSKADVGRLGGELPQDELGIGPATRERVRSIYFDTPKHDRHAAGISLRLRQQNGGWLQTVKADQHVHGGLSNPIELEGPVERAEPDVAKIADKKIKRTVEKAVKGTTLKPVFETIVQRTTRTIQAQGSEIELAVDGVFPSAWQKHTEVTSRRWMPYADRSTSLPERLMTS
jgi:triphosphatase